MYILGINRSEFFRMLVSSITAGACIAIGGTAFLSVDNRVIGSVLFAVGLYTVCIFRLHLFTGKVSHIGRSGGLSPELLLLVWAGNFLGTAIIVRLLLCTRLAPALVERALELCAVKEADNLLSLFALGALCNGMIYIAVELFQEDVRARIPPGGCYFALMFGVVVFVTCGFEHSIADLFYFSLSGELVNGRAWLCILAVTLGNTMGGVICHRVRLFIKTL